MLVRAALAAVLAALIGGDAARLGWDAFGLWRLTFPFLWLFVLLETARARRRVEDGEAFLAGAAVALLHGGLYAKELQHGFYPLGVDWLGAVSACFDGGMTAVLALHAAALLRPRRAEDPEPGVLLPGAFLVFVLGAAACVYGIKTAFNFYRAERMLGPTWLLADVLFLWGAWAILKRAKERSEEEENPERERWVWGLAAFAVWLPGARLVARACDAFGLPDPLLYFFVLGWSAGAGVVFWRLWRERGHADPAPAVRSKPAEAAALWRAAGALLLAVVLGTARTDDRAAGVFSAFVDLPARALFAWAFLASRLAI